MSRLEEQASPTPEIPDYVILRTLGAGRWARVFLATQKSLGRPVAVKVLTCPDEAFQARFDREAAVMATVSHPTVVSIIDRGTVDDQHYIVMEYMEGGSLRDRLIPGQPMSVASVRPVISAVSAALTTLHAQGLIHRDVKPDNVLFDRTGQIKLCDFGISVPIGQAGLITDVDTSPGTIDYMAPEQRYRLDVSQSADQFAFAVMIYELLTGVLPGHAWRPPSAKNSAVNAEVDAVVERALQEDPEDRFPNVASFFEALDRALFPPSKDTAQSAEEQTESPRQGGIVAVAMTVLLAGGLAVYLAATRNDIPDEAGRSGPGGTTVAQSDPVQQTGALIWRMNAEGKIEVLIVRARSGGHWTIPKANQREETTQTEVAEEEAFEEAGIRGTASPTTLGTYWYRRKGKDYTVTVVPVRLNEETDTWPEDFRTREWHSISDASEQIADDDLRQIVANFDPQPE